MNRILYLSVGIKPLKMVMDAKNSIFLSKIKITKLILLGDQITLTEDSNVVWLNRDYSNRRITVDSVVTNFQNINTKLKI